MLAPVARGRDDLKDMRGVCKSWEAGFEASVTSIRVSYSGPSLPPAAALQGRFPALTKLNLGACCCMDETRLRDLQGLDKLRSLNLGLTLPGVLKSLEDTNGTRSRSLPLKLTDSGMEGLRGMQLTELNLDNCWDVRDSGFENLRGMPLKSLDFGWGKVSNLGLESLEGMPLNHLDLSFSKNISDEGLAFLGALPLTSLSLGAPGKGMSDAGLFHLKGLPLRGLLLFRWKKLTDEGLAHLHGMPLEILSLHECPKITPAGVEDLRKSINGVHVSFRIGCFELFD